ncbi:MAG TPA: M20/M25/M40 family metallo-hydrolase [Chitinophagaceae bacterium]|nr:M20/M25/M40 family metallo-hydrolase [Chitinophagaceae bacterium]
MRKSFLIILSFMLSLQLINAQEEKLDMDMINKIRKEGLENSKVMEIAMYLTDVSGPRLTASPGYMRAATWAKNKLTEWGLSNANLEPWGEFGKGWEQTKCYVAMTAPYYVPLIAMPRAWTGSTPGKNSMTGDVILIKAKDSVELLKYAGKLKDKIVMTWSEAKLSPSFEPDGNRFADSSLEKMAKAEPRSPQQGGQRNQQGNNPNPFMLQRRMNEMINKEKPALVLTMTARGTDGTIFVSSGGQYAKDAETAPASVVLSSDDYLRIQRLIEAGVPVTLEAEVKTKFYRDDLKGYNVIAEIPGTDPVLKEEVVMLGGHLDSWHGATGATDNAAGCAVMMEAVRILKASGFKSRRTIRIALWSGEEQGLHGSRNYVKNHFADPAKMVPTAEHGKVSAYYNLDNGTGKIRGIYLQGNKEAGPIFSKWLEPFKDLGAGTVTINNTGGTDHQAFDGVGIPGFQFIQDQIEYNTRTHHTNMDTYDHLVADDLKQAATIVASFVYNTAQRDQKIPRKAMPLAQTQNRAF